MRRGSQEITDLFYHHKVLERHHTGIFPHIIEHRSEQRQTTSNIATMTLQPSSRQSLQRSRSQGTASAPREESSPHGAPVRHLASCPATRRRRAASESEAHFVLSEFCARSDSRLSEAATECGCDSLLSPIPSLQMPSVAAHLVPPTPAPLAAPGPGGDSMASADHASSAETLQASTRISRPLRALRRLLTELDIPSPARHCEGG
jgi:hypothetical protein